jgi:phosphoribosylanthranilate isomerase
VISIIQLHGSESEAYLAALRALLPDAQIWKAFQIRSEQDLDAAANSTADLVLLDNGNGSGARFDWSLVQAFHRPYILAGGLTPETIPDAIERLHPYALDLSSGVETDGVKNGQKMLAAVAAARRR